MFTKHQADDDLRAEFEAHLEMETAEYIRRGMSPNDARRQALLASGGLAQAAEAVSDQRGVPWIEHVVADVRYALRTLRHHPTFTTVVVLTLGLGIGANTAIFSVVRGVVLKPLPHREGDRLIYLRHSSDGPAGENILFSVPEVQDFRDGAGSLGGIAEYSPFSFTMRWKNEVSRVRAGLVTGNFFDVMGLAPVLGRVTDSTNDGPGVPAVMVLTHDYWRKRFNGDSSIVGAQFRMEGKLVTVIGVMEPAPYFPDRVDAFLNMVISDHHLSATMVQGRSHRMTEMIARLAPDASLDLARAEVAAVYQRLTSTHRATYDPAANFRVTVLPFREALGARAHLTLWLLGGAAAFVLIIAAANVANLTLIRGIRREPELVARAALGAGSGRLRRMLLVENLVLCLLGAAVGVTVAFAGEGLLTALVDRYSARANEIRLDLVVLGFSLALSFVLALLLSLLAALPKEGVLAAMIAGGGRRATGGVKRQRLQRTLVVAQVAVSVVLLTGAGLLTRTMLELSQVQTGLRTEEVLTMDVPLLALADLRTPGADAGAKARYHRMLEEIRGIPGVLDAGVGSPSPLRRSSVLFEVKAEGKALSPGEAAPQAELRTADPDYFRAAGIPLMRGRAFQATDQARSGLVVVINQVLADRMFPNEDPIGRQIAWTGDVLRFTPISGEWRTVVGVTGNTQDGGPDVAPRAVMFLPFTQTIAFGGSLVVRAKGDAAGLSPAVTAAVRRVVPDALIENVMTVAQIKDERVAPRRLNAALVSSFGVLAVLIAAVGIAGVLVFSVSARTGEIGIRMSLGADRGMVQRMILREGATLLAAGTALGVVGAFLASRVIRGLLFGISPGDPLTLVAVSAVMTTIGMVACWIPAVRAARIDPAITMRST
jgi:predicted permease